MVPTHALRIQDGGRPPSWKNWRIAISQPWFDRFWRNLARWCNSTLLTVPTVKNLKFQKSKMAAAAILINQNTKIAISRPVFCYYTHSSVMDMWTRLWGRYHVSQSVFLVSTKKALNRSRTDHFNTILADWKLHNFAAFHCLITVLNSGLFLYYLFSALATARHGRPSQHFPFPPVDNIWAISIVWKIGGEIKCHYLRDYLLLPLALCLFATSFFPSPISLLLVSFCLSV